METQVLLIFLLAVLIILILVDMKHHFPNKRLNRLFYRSSEIASDNNLNFSSQLVLHDMVLGIDGIHRKLMMIREIDGITNFNIIDLDKITDCSIHKEYQTIQAGALQNKSLDQYLRSISLHLRLASGTLINLPFYEKGRDALHEMHVCETRARDWESMLNKMLLKKKRA